MQSLPLYIIAALALIVTPGPDIIYVLSRGIADGRAGGLVSALGVTCGICTRMIGLGLIYAVMTIAFLSILGNFAGLIGAWLKSRRSVAGNVRWVPGLILMLLGVRLLVSQRS
jgi:threonine/homoserine/homoserine lactone efflux protein